MSYENRTALHTKKLSSYMHRSLNLEDNTLMLRLFRRKMFFVVKYFEGNHFQENVFHRKHFSVFGTYGKSQIFFIFSFNHINS
jgi:hypothetical protein